VTGFHNAGDSCSALPRSVYYGAQATYIVEYAHCSCYVSAFLGFVHFLPPLRNTAFFISIEIHRFPQFARFSRAVCLRVALRSCRARPTVHWRIGSDVAIDFHRSGPRVVDAPRVLSRRVLDFPHRSTRNFCRPVLAVNVTNA